MFNDTPNIWAIEKSESPDLTVYINCHRHVGADGDAGVSIGFVGICGHGGVGIGGQGVGVGGQGVGVGGQGPGAGELPGIQIFCPG